MAAEGRGMTITALLTLLADTLGPLQDITVERVPPRTTCFCADLGDDGPCGWCDGPDREAEAAR
jgi:hypothetical protein